MDAPHLDIWPKKEKGSTTVVFYRHSQFSSNIMKIVGINPGADTYHIVGPWVIGTDTNIEVIVTSFTKSSP